jgi:hypothetical protein
MIQFMKKCIVFILALAYLLAGTGILFKQHFCGGEFVSEELDFRDIAPPSLHVLCEQASGDSDSCCATHLKLVKKNQDQKVTTSLEWSFLDLCDFVSNSNLAYPVLSHYSELGVDLLPLQKPPPPSVPIYLTLCTWRI